MNTTYYYHSPISSSPVGGVNKKGLFIKIAKDFALLGASLGAGYIFGSFLAGNLTMIRRKIRDLDALELRVQELADQHDSTERAIALINRKIRALEVKVSLNANGNINNPLIQEMLADITRESRNILGNLDHAFRDKIEELESTFKTQQEALIIQKQEIRDESNSVLDQSATSIQQVKTQTIQEMKRIEEQHKSNLQQRVDTLVTRMDELVRDYGQYTDGKLKNINSLYKKMKALDVALKDEHESQRK